MARFLKKTTGLTGLAVAEHPHEKLTSLYDKLLRSLSKMPEDAAYRKNTESIVKERLNIVKTESDIQKLEEKLNAGQVEEVILQAERELSLSRKMLMWKPWEAPVGQIPKNQWKWPL